MAVALGGMIGTLARHAINLTVGRLSPRPIPYATAVVNLTGSVAIGALAGAIASGRLSMSLPLRAFVFVGILGGFTTFSSFMLDTLMLAGSGAPATAAANLLGQTIVGILLTYVAYRVFV
jgi:CrcB protein